MPRGLIITILFLLIGRLAYNWMGPFNWGEGGGGGGGLAFNTQSQCVKQTVVGEEWIT